ncbi:hypothetical protein H257_11341 [Aphanomyces astaci]|uniref:DDE Tnp4 domain-containing protein n=1 Tax=Aphanomyces astaci TaxID=112090 RepID=W4G2T9_APHAT|nr:hypothetical protein H257_11341 [Aphanomyces astaci]ETV74027.1 hypothetical protein H257_11341 [Aphanomyces astaci]|eukprot:XP_009836540.1 hypothetical protein H257_11341 [Aphanomyces astaci]
MRLLRLIAYVVERPLVPDVRFDLLALSDADSTLKFRFDVAGVQALVSALRLPVVILTSSHDRCLSTEALCITLYRMSYPRRYYDMMATFGRSRESICRIFNDIIDALYSKWNQVLYFCQHIVADRLPAYSSAIVSKGSPMEKIFGFIDGSKFETCRITQKRSRRQLGFSDLQRLLYSGHKCRHCLNFQAVTAPDGLCVHFWGPMGKAHATTPRCFGLAS